MIIIYKNTPNFLKCIVCHLIPSKPLQFGNIKIICQYCTKVYRYQFGNHFIFQPLLPIFQFLINFIKIECLKCQQQIIIRKYEKHIRKCAGTEMHKDKLQFCNNNQLNLMAEEDCLLLQNNYKQCSECRQQIALSSQQLHHSECQEQIIKCDNLKCDWEGKRKYFKQHYEECTQKVINLIEHEININQYAFQMAEFQDYSFLMQKNAYFEEYKKLHFEDSEHEN